MRMCLVLFVVCKILDSSELFSCLLEMGLEYYYLVPWYVSEKDYYCVGRRGTTARPREVKRSSRDAAVFT